MAHRESSILVVDDNADIRDLLSFILEDEGYTVLTATEGEAALAVIKESEPELVLLDIMMPGRSGIDILKEVRSSKRESINQTPIVMITAKSQVADIDEALEAGATSYIVKPFRAEALLEKVQSFLPQTIK